MPDPFEILGIPASSDEAAVRRAYHQLARRWHPDQFQTEEERETATRRMVALNHAYEEALSSVSPAEETRRPRTISCDDAVDLGAAMLNKGYPESALQQLLRAESRNAAWYALQGKVLMEMGQFLSAEQSYREAVRLEPDNLTYRAGALDALVALRKSRTLTGRIRHLLGKDRR